MPTFTISIYLTNTRPDISYSFQQLSQYMTTLITSSSHSNTQISNTVSNTRVISSQVQIKAFVTQIVTAAKTLANQSVVFAFSQATHSYRGNHKNKLLFQNFQPRPSIVCEIEWLTYILNDLKVLSIKPTLLYRDNHSARHIASNS